MDARPVQFQRFDLLALLAGVKADPLRRGFFHFSDDGGIQVAFLPAIPQRHEVDNARGTHH